MYQWKYLEDNINYLTESELVTLKTLYASLKQLSEEEITFLSDKYNIDREELEDNNKSYLKDEIVAKKKGMSNQAYKEKRRKVESKLNVFISKFKEVHEDELSKATQLNYFK